jgi:ATP-binding cassette subfamily F protein 3
MSGFDVEKTLRTHLSTLDEDILGYLISVVGDMSLEEKRSSQSLQEVISPFLVDSGFVSSEEDANACCKTISVAFGGSGFKSTTAISDDYAPMLLAAPIKIIDNSDHLKVKKSSYGGAVLTGAGEGQMNDNNHNTSLEVKFIPTTQKQVRKMRRENEQLQKILKVEAAQRAEAEQEMLVARMSAIKASRAVGKQSSLGVNIDRFSIPHPSGTSDLLTDATLTLAPGRRYGLIGKNGSGKSTLMTRIANYKIDGLMHLRILLVDQHVEGDERSALEWVLRADVERTSLLEDEARLIAWLHKVDDSEPLPADLKGVNLEVALAECYERMESIGVNSAETRAIKILQGLGFEHGMMTNPTNGLSGGWAMRAALAAALFVKPNLLLLDEPTNHLDLHALVWLENWLVNQFTGIAVIVSHDQVFLNAVCTDVLELKSTLAGQSKSSLIHYSGDYDTYENTVEEQKKAQARLRVAYEKETEKLREFISREGKKYDNPAHQSQRRMKIKQLEGLMEVERVEEDSELVMNFPKPYGVFDSTENMIAIKDVSFSWPGQEPLFEKVDFCIGARARLAILGKNGCGKTSLLNILMGESDPTEGSVSRHLGCRITMLQQHHYKGEQLDPNLSPLDHMRRLPQEDSSAVGLHDPGTRQEETAQRSYLSNFGVNGGRATLPVKYLSGGQRMRVALAVALYKRPDLLILDEVSFFATFCVTMPDIN